MHCLRDKLRLVLHALRVDDDRRSRAKAGKACVPEM